MVVTHSGPTGLSVVRHAQEELSVALVHAPILGLQTVGETAGDWDRLQNCEDVTHILSAEVKVLLSEQKSILEIRVSLDLAMVGVGYGQG